MPRFVIQQQDPVGPHDLHRSWTDVYALEASDRFVAIQTYCGLMHWEGVSIYENVATVPAFGTLRAVAAEMADAVRISPPRTS